MSKLLVVIVCGMLFVGVGCKAEGEVGDNDATVSGTSSASGSSASAGADACSHCEGKQTAKADGSCPMCGAKPK